MSEQAAIEFVPVSNLSRRDDPETSRLAALHMHDSGKRKDHCAEVYRALCRWPEGWTAAELHDRWADWRNEKPIGDWPEWMDSYEFSRRLADLKKVENGGLAVVEMLQIGGDGKPKAAKRKCSIKGTPCMVWRPRTEGRG